MKRSSKQSFRWGRLVVIAAACLGLSYATARAADEICSACGQDVRLSGTFEHRAESASMPIQGAGENLAAFSEAITGKEFSVTISNLPAGTFKVTIGEVETEPIGPGERVFDVTSGDKTLAKNFDIVAAAGGTAKVTTIKGDVEHAEDMISGPLRITFTASKGLAKFNTLTVADTAGSEIVSVKAKDLAQPFTGDATKIPEIAEAPIWRDPSHPLDARIDDLVRRMSLEEKVSQLQNGAPGIPRLGLPAYNYWSEALHGVANQSDVTVYPQAVGLAATWDPAMLKKVAHTIGIEGRGKFNDYASQHNGDGRLFVGLTFWSPNINIFRDPRWGRGQETYGEDPFLSGTMGVSFIEGLQGDDPTYMLAMACAKHFAVHSGPEPERHRFDASPSQRDLYEMYLPQFEMAVRKGKVGGVMGAYNSVFGVPCCASDFLLTAILRDKWGFGGYIVSDCGAIGNIWNPNEHHYVQTREEAAAAAVKAGCNLCCGGDYNALVSAVQKGLISVDEINNALHHTLWTRFRLGLFDPPADNPFSKIGLDQVNTPEHRQLALEAARKAIVLLKNDGALPLDRTKLKKIAVFGQNANVARMLWGNYNGTPSSSVTILDGIRKAAGAGVQVDYAEGCPLVEGMENRGRGFGGRRRGGPNAATPVPPRPPAELRAEALKLAEDADVLIYVGGINSQLEGEEMRTGGLDGFNGGDRTKIELPQIQEDFVHALKATGKPVIMVNCSGSAMAMPWEAENLPAILQAWYPGEEGGTAVGEILFGDVNPSGRLPVTFYKSTADLPDFEDYSFKNRTYRYFEGKPLWAFGHGLSYTTFEIADAAPAEEKVATDGTVKLSFTVKNTGKVAGDEVAQVYYRNVDSKVPQPNEVLCGFTRVHLDPGASQKVTVEVPTQRLRYWSTEKKDYVVEPGKYEFRIGAASDDIRQSVAVTLN